MVKNEKALVFLLFLTGILSRIFFIEKMQSHWDGAQYSIAVVRYSLIQQTPAAPGYPIYIGIAKFLYIFLKDPHLAIVMVSVIFSGIGAVIFYFSGKVVFNRTVGLIASLLFLSSTTFYFFGITANPYGTTGINSALMAMVSYLIFKKKQNLGIVFGFIFSYSIGFRPQDALFLLPVYVWTLKELKNNEERIKTVLASFISCLFWIIPLVLSAGGLHQYLFILTPSSEVKTNLTSYMNGLLNRVFIIIKGGYLTFGLASVFLLALIFIKKFWSDKKTVILFGFWIVPSFLFNLFVRSDHAAHQMTYLSGLLVLIAFAIYSALKKKHILRTMLLIVIVLFNLFTFFRNRDPNMTQKYVDQSYHYSEIKKNDIRMSSQINFIEKNFDPNKTLIVTSLPMWRPYMYYLKKYPVYALGGLDSFAPQFLNLKIFSKDWNMAQENNRPESFSIPSSVTNILFVDDDAKIWIKSKNSHTYNLSGNSSISQIKILKKEKFTYGYHKITVYE